MSRPRGSRKRTKAPVRFESVKRTDELIRYERQGTIGKLFDRRQDLVPALLLFRSASKKGISTKVINRISPDAVSEFSRNGVIKGLPGGGFFVLTQAAKQHLASLRT